MHASQKQFELEYNRSTPLHTAAHAGDQRGGHGVARPAQAARTHTPRRRRRRRRSSRSPCDTTPVPFTSLGLDARLLEGIRDLGFADTRPIQTAVIPLALGTQRSDRLRRNRHRQDRRVRRADAAVAADARPAAESRDGGPDRGSDARSRAASSCSRRRASSPCRSRTKSTASPTTRTSPAPRSTAASRWACRSARSRPASTSSSPRPAA